jgi:putative PIN family toxin of toxin-antitoxin system
MIVVLDTNVIVSALLSPEGPPAEIIRRWEEEVIEAAISSPLLEELERVLNYKQERKYFKDPQEKIAAFIRAFRKAALIAEPRGKLDIVKADPSDNRVLECAVASGAAYIITGDSHLLELKEFKGIIILSPAGFLTALELER